MTVVSQISDYVQKFGFASGKKQVLSIIQNFINNFGQAGFAALLYPGDGASYGYDTQAIYGGARRGFNLCIASKEPVDSVIINQAAELLEPFFLKYFMDGSGFEDAGSINIMDYVEIETPLGPTPPFAARKRRRSGFAVKGSLLMPVFLDNRVFSIFGVFDENEFSLSKEEFSNINVMGYMTAISLKNIFLTRHLSSFIADAARRGDAESSTNYQLSGIYELSRKFTSASSYDDALNAALEIFSRAFGIEQAAIMTLSNQKKELYVEKAAGIGPELLRSYNVAENTGIIGNCVRKGTPYLRRAPLETTAELAVFPLPGVSGLPAGAVVLYDRSKKITLSENEFELMNIVANMLSLSLNFIKLKSAGETSFMDKANEIKNIDLLLEVINPHLSAAEIIEKALCILSKIFGARSAMVFRAEDGRDISPWMGLSNGEIELFSGDGGFGDEKGHLKRIIGTTQPGEVTFDAGFTPESGAAKYLSGNAICLPVEREGGAKYLYVICGPGTFGVDRRSLSLAVKIIEKALEAHLQAAEKNSNISIEVQTQTARDIQKKLLPAGYFSEKKFEIAAYCEPASFVGGDYYDIIANETTNVTSVAIADVSGRGIHAVMITAMLRTQLRILSSSTPDAKKMMFTLNNLICQDIDLYNFITLFYLQISSSGGRAVFCNAGHNPVMHYISNGNNVVIHESKNSPLGIMRNIEFKEGILLLDSGDILVLYTNGLCEIKNAGGEFFGRDRLVGFLTENSSLGAVELKEKLISTINEYSDSTVVDDDVTFVVIKVV